MRKYRHQLVLCVVQCIVRLCSLNIRALLITALLTLPAFISVPFAATPDAVYQYSDRLGKPGAPIFITGVKQYSIEPNVETEIIVQLDVSRFATGSLMVELNPDTEIVLVDTESTFEFDLSESDRQIEIPVTIKTTQNGRYYLMLIAQLQSENNLVQAKSLGLVIQSGAEVQLQTTQPQALKKTAANDQQRVKSFAAEETVY